MKIEQLIVQYLYKNKEVRIQDIGHFSLSPDVIIPQEGDKNNLLPEGAIHFEYDKKALPDEGLIDFIKEQSGKIRSLAASDLESFVILTRQFLNIGKPLHMDGLGVLQKNQEGNLVFAQGQEQGTLKEFTAPAGIREKIKEDISFASESPKSNSRSKGWMIAVLSIFIISAAVAAYYYFTKEKNTEEAIEPTTETMVTDSLSNKNPKVQLPTDTLPTKDSVKTNPPITGSTGAFSIVLKEYTTRAAAEKAFNKLSNWGHKITLTTTDSVLYKIEMPFAGPLSDSSRARDSLKRFFGGKPYVKI